MSEQRRITEQILPNSLTISLSTLVQVGFSDKAYCNPTVLVRKSLSFESESDKIFVRAGVLSEITGNKNRESYG